MGGHNVTTEISKIVLPDGASYDIKDAVARAAIGSISGALKYLGATTTSLSDGSTANPIIIGSKSVTAVAGDVVIYGNLEFVWSDTDSKWHEFGSTGSLKALAFKDNATGNYTPAGTVSAPTVTVSVNTASVKPFGSAGTLPSCTLPEMTATVSGETLTLGWTAGSFSAGTLPSAGTDVTVATGIKSATASAPAFTGTSGSITVE